MEDTSRAEGIGVEDELENGVFYSSPEGLVALPSDRDFQFAAARFLLKTREERKITQAAVDGIVQDVTDLWDEGMKQV